MGSTVTGKVIATGLVVMCVTVGAVAQDSPVRQVDSPYQEDFQYSLGDELRPRVAIGDVFFVRVVIAPRDDEPIDPDEEVELEVTMEFDNRGAYNKKAKVILLLEDADGGPLERIVCDPVKINDGRSKEDRQRFDVPGAAALATERVYIFCELD